MITITNRVPVRILAEMVARLDRLGGLVPREACARRPLEKAISADERRTRRRGHAR